MIYPLIVTFLAAAFMVWVYRTKPTSYWTLTEGLEFMLAGAGAIIVSLVAWLVWLVVT